MVAFHLRADTAPQFCICMWMITVPVNTVTSCYGEGTVVSGEKAIW